MERSKSTVLQLILLLECNVFDWHLKEETSYINVKEDELDYREERKLIARLEFLDNHNSTTSVKQDKSKSILHEFCFTSSY